MERPRTSPAVPSRTALALCTPGASAPLLVQTLERSPAAQQLELWSVGALPITRHTLGYVYIIHFSRPLGNLSNPRAQARHYTGFALDPLRRFVLHCSGQGAKITRAAVVQGITLTLAAVWPAPQRIEYELKRRIKNTPRFCPLCCAAQGWRCRTPHFVTHLLDDSTDFPPIPPGRDRLDGYEVAWLRRCVRVTGFNLTGLDADDIPY